MVTTEEAQEESSSSNNSDNSDKHLVGNHCDNNYITSEINHMIIKVCGRRSSHYISIRPFKTFLYRLFKYFA